MGPSAVGLVLSSGPGRRRGLPGHVRRRSAFLYDPGLKKLFKPDTLSRGFCGPYNHVRIMTTMGHTVKTKIAGALDTYRGAQLPTPPKDIVISKKQVGERVRALRDARDMSQGQLAKVLGIQPTNVSAIERGVRGLSLQQLAKLATALDVSPGEILDGQPSKQSRSASPDRLPRRFGRIRGLPRTKRRVLYEIIDAFLEKHGSSGRA